MENHSIYISGRTNIKLIIDRELDINPIDMVMLNCIRHGMVSKYLKRQEKGKDIFYLIHKGFVYSNVNRYLKLSKRSYERYFKKFIDLKLLIPLYDSKHSRYPYYRPSRLFIELTADQAYLSLTPNQKQSEVSKLKRPHLEDRYQKILKK